MKILHVVAHVDANASYGGPAQIALALADAQVARGHRVDVVASSGGRESRIVRRESGAVVRVFAGSFALGRGRYFGLLSPGVIAWVSRHSREYDVVHVHMARDLLTLPCALASRSSRLIIQTHGMIREAQPLLSMLARPALARAFARAHVVLALTELEAQVVKAAAGRGTDVRVAPNFVTVDIADDLHARRPQHEAVFLGRLHSRKRPTLFVECAALVQAEISDLTFAIVGPDGGQAARVDELIRARGLTSRCVREGPVDHAAVPARLSRAAVYVHTARDEPFGLTIAEAMARGVPVVITRTSGLASLVSASGAGIVADDTADALARAVIEIVSDPARALEMGRAGQEVAAREFAIEGWIDMLDGQYGAKA